MNQPTTITSRDNEQLKYARRVRDGKGDDAIFIEGTRLVEEALRSGIAIERMFISDEAVERIADAIDFRNAPGAIHVSGSAFASIADTVTSQGVIAIGRRPATSLAVIERRLPTATVPIVVFLQEINNPSNLGAVLRTAEAAGVAGVIVSPGSADVYSPKSLRAAMGSSFRLPVVTDMSLDDAIIWAGPTGLSTVASDIRGERLYTDLDWRQPRLLVMGSEGHGLPAEVLKKLDELMLIPMDGEVESLNLAVACGIVLFEARRQVA